MILETWCKLLWSHHLFLSIWIKKKRGRRAEMPGWKLGVLGQAVGLQNASLSETLVLEPEWTIPTWSKGNRRRSCCPGWDFCVGSQLLEQVLEHLRNMRHRQGSWLEGLTLFCFAVCLPERFAFPWLFCAGSHSHFCDSVRTWVCGGREVEDSKVRCCQWAACWVVEGPGCSLQYLLLTSPESRGGPCTATFALCLPALLTSFTDLWASLWSDPDCSPTSTDA